MVHSLHHVYEAKCVLFDVWDSILLYSNTQRLPNWAKEWTKLTYL
jgi:hypothetical protein